MTQEQQRTLDAMIAADEKFQTAIIKQFGKSKAYMRYHSAKHNAETQSAASAFHKAVEVYRACFR